MYSHSVMNLIEFMESIMSLKSIFLKLLDKYKFHTGVILQLQSFIKLKTLDLIWKVSLVESNIVQITNLKPKMHGEESKQLSHIKFGVCTLEMKLVIFPHQELLGMTIKKLLKLTLSQDMLSSEDGKLTGKLDII